MQQQMYVGLCRENAGTVAGWLVLWRYPLARIGAGAANALFLWSYRSVHLPLSVIR